MWKRGEQVSKTWARKKKKKEEKNSGKPHCQSYRQYIMFDLWHTKMAQKIPKRSNKRGGSSSSLHHPHIHLIIFRFIIIMLIIDIVIKIDLYPLCFVPINILRSRILSPKPAAIYSPSGWIATLGGSQNCICL